LAAPTSSGQRSGRIIRKEDGNASPLFRLAPRNLKGRDFKSCIRLGLVRHGRRCVVT